MRNGKRRGGGGGAMRDKLERPSRSQLRAHEWQYLVLCVSLHEGVHEKREKEKKKEKRKTLERHIDPSVFA